MAYEISWDTPGKLLRLRMADELSVEAFVEIDQQINACLQSCDARITLIVDASKARVSPYGIERIKPTQTYLQSRQIERLVVVSENKLSRLTMLLLFNLCRPQLQFCENFDQAQRFLGPLRSLSGGGSLC